MPMRTCSAPARVRAARLGEYLSLAMAACTASRVSWRTLFSPLMTRETVMGAKPAYAATSAIVGAPCFLCFGLRSGRAGKRFLADRIVMRSQLTKGGTRVFCAGTGEKRQTIDKGHSEQSW